MKNKTSHVLRYVYVEYVAKSRQVVVTGDSPVRAPVRARRTTGACSCPGAVYLRQYHHRVYVVS